MLADFDKLKIVTYDLELLFKSMKLKLLGNRTRYNFNILIKKFANIVNQWSSKDLLSS